MIKVTKKKTLILILVLISALLFVFVMNRIDFGEFSSMRDISTFKDNPTGLFLLKNADYKYIDHVTPFFGKGLSCAHTGGHINFTSENAPYEAEIITPVDGIVKRIEPCFNLGTHDKFDIAIEFASYKGKYVTLDYSIEPMDGLRCQNDPDYYKKYIKVELGQTVKAGDVIAVMPKFSSTSNNGTHIHFNLYSDSQMRCPNIFNQDVVNDYADMFWEYGCQRQPITERTFCYNPGEGEDIVN
jgi:hypothetical protein